MSQKIDLEQLASFLSNRKKARRKKQKKKKKKKFKLVVLDGRQETQTRSDIINKLGIQENVTDARKEPAYDKLKKRAEGGSLSLIYALQKDVKDIQNRFQQQPQQTAFSPFTPFPRAVSQQTAFQDKNLSYDSAIEAQRVATENKKNQDRIEKEAKAEVKRLEKEALAVVKKLEKQAKDEQKRVIKEQALLEKRLKKQAEAEQERQTKLIKTEVFEEVKRVKNPNVRKKLGKVSVIPLTIAQGMRTFTDFKPNPPDIGQGGGLPPLPFNRERDQYDPLEPTPFYRSTADRIENPVLQEVLDAYTAVPTEDSFSIPDLEGVEDDEEQVDDALLGGGASEMTTTDAEPPVQERAEVAPPPKAPNLVAPPPTAPNLRRRGRPAGSKNKSKKTGN
jgi:hypothetical protein